MYTLGIPDRQKRRTLGYLKQQWIEFEEHPAMEGFFDVNFPDMDEDAFRDIVMKLKQQGVTVIGADEVLTEKKIMKLTDLLKEEFSKNLDEGESDSLVQALKNILTIWENKKYPDDKTRWEEYYMDIEELIEDFEDNKRKDVPADQVSSKSTEPLAEEKVRKAIRKLMRQ